MHTFDHMYTSLIKELHFGHNGCTIVHNQNKSEVGAHILYAYTRMYICDTIFAKL